MVRSLLDTNTVDQAIRNLIRPLNDDVYVFLNIPRVTRESAARGAMDSKSATSKSCVPIPPFPFDREVAAPEFKEDGVTSRLDSVRRANSSSFC